MIQPEQIRRRAERLYPDFLRAWLAGQPDFFPCIIHGRRRPDSDDQAAAIQAMRRLREGSKEVRGFGYSVRWREINSRTFGRNQFPEEVSFPTQDDFLRFLGKQQEFAAIAEVVTRLRAAFPVLESWIQSNPRRLAELAPDLDGLLEVLQYFVAHPRPNVFARELPLGVDTKFIERHEPVLRSWFDLTLPAHTIRADEKEFARRYGLRSAERHLLVRLLDPELGQELGLPFLEFSLPVDTLGALPVHAGVVLIVENKVNLLTLPPVRRGVGLGTLGSAVTVLRYVPWLEKTPIIYWGDIDVEGFCILSSLRALFPQTRSRLMDFSTLHRWASLTGPGSGNAPSVPPHLTDAEQAAFLRCRDENLRLEQERLPQKDIVAVFSEIG